MYEVETAYRCEITSDVLQRVHMSVQLLRCVNTQMSKTITTVDMVQLNISFSVQL